MNTNKIFLLFGVLFFASSILCCINPPNEENVCLYGSKQIGDNKSGACLTTNANPFSSSPPGSGGREECNSLVRQDGTKCIEYYAKLLCSRDCSKCEGSLTQGKKVCKSLCDDVQKECPLSTEGKCFDSIGFACADTDDSDECTDWNVDKSKLPPATGDGGDNDDGDDSDDDSSNANAISFLLIAASFFAIYIIDF